jgi:hypothetical protein
MICRSLAATEGVSALTGLRNSSTMSTHQEAFLALIFQQYIHLYIRLYVHSITLSNLHWYIQLPTHSTMGTYVI